MNNHEIDIKDGQGTVHMLVLSVLFLKKCRKSLFVRSIYILSLCIPCYVYGHPPPKEKTRVISGHPFYLGKQAKDQVIGPVQSNL